VNEQVVDSVTASNFKAIGEAQAVYMNLAIGNAVAHQQSMNQLSAALTAKAAEMLGTTDISEAGGLVALLQQAMKGAQTTPPPTA
jgi:uncharacterized membrane protein